MCRTLCLLLSALALSFAAAGVPCSLDPLLKTPDNWQLTQDKFEETYTSNGNKLFVWLTKDKTRAKLTPRLYANAIIELKAFEGKVPAQEVIVDFADGKLNLVSISFYNRGDNGMIDAETLKERFMTIGKAVGDMLKAAPQRRAANPNNGLLTEGYGWDSPQMATALLEHNEGALTNGSREFLRLRICRPNAPGSLAASMRHSRGGAAAKLGDLPRNVAKNAEGDVYVDKLPMVDQGAKGYCVAASVQRLFEYYGIGADMHQIAEIAGTDPQMGTNPLYMSKQLDKIDYRFKTRLEIIAMGQPLTEVEKKRGEYYVGKPVTEAAFLKAIHSNIDDGLPLLWTLELGRYPEKPQLNPQTAGGHMRMIIGYNDKTHEIIFSDSWGAGHESKRMDMTHAYQASHGLFALKPTVR
ncbi:MAG TPA: C39 family peptidase [Luteolibacter sp.]|nr:C39 family peptidase [Luteolibacter sp.]